MQMDRESASDAKRCTESGANEKGKSGEMNILKSVSMNFLSFH